ncbi:hypothetical protein PM3016_7321 [Paenibacillus mucilaginosus 3016]|uniref:Uncharacterized protein n=1 Tax=Paenibacillus mucilaginosus 3016 TaxID=1116391 RepID=H6NEB5_9BACL|nr:hypothetical protein PM3016_7321 [Paenibacillus mucilaginosus 3016]
MGRIHFLSYGTLIRRDHREEVCFVSLDGSREEREYTVELEGMEEEIPGAAEDEGEDHVHVEWAGYI